MTPQAVPYEVVPLTPALLGDFLAFFDGPAFADNPRWASCYCQFTHEDHSTVDWERRTGEQNRALACERIGAGVTRGFLAIADGEAAGWASAGPRVGYRALDGDDVPDAADVGSLVCFVVAPEWRRRGVATALLGAALSDFAARGLAVAEAYPFLNATTPAQHHHGPLEMFERAGFARHGEDGDGTVTMRLALGAAGS